MRGAVCDGRQVEARAIGAHVAALQIHLSASHSAECRSGPGSIPPPREDLAETGEPGNQRAPGVVCGAPPLVQQVPAGEVSLPTKTDRAGEDRDPSGGGGAAAAAGARVVVEEAAAAADAGLGQLQLDPRGGLVVAGERRGDGTDLLVAGEGEERGGAP